MKINNISVDLLFVSLPLDSIPEEINLLDDVYLRNLDEPGVRSINGSRVTEMILKLVPHKDNFRTTLVAVKHWAKVSHLFSIFLSFNGFLAYRVKSLNRCEVFIQMCWGF
jgi:poly(A) polymerase